MTLRELINRTLDFDFGAFLADWVPFLIGKIKFAIEKIRFATYYGLWGIWAIGWSLFCLFMLTEHGSEWTFAKTDSFIIMLSQLSIGILIYVFGVWAIPRFLFWLIGWSPKRRGKEI